MITKVQPVCATCWWDRHDFHPFREPRAPDTSPDTCAICGEDTAEGIYDRLDPGSVAFPSW